MDTRSASMSSQGRDGSAPSLPRVPSGHKLPLSADSLAGGAPTDGTDSTSRRPPGPPVRKKSLSCSTLPMLAVASKAPSTGSPANNGAGQPATAQQVLTARFVPNALGGLPAAPWSARPLQRTVSVGSCLSQPAPGATGRWSARRAFPIAGGVGGGPTLCLNLSLLTARPRSHAVSHEDVGRQQRTFSDFLNDGEQENARLSPSAKCVRWLEHMQLVGGGRCLDDAVYKDAANG